MIKKCKEVVIKENLRGGKGKASIQSLLSNGDRLDGVSFVGLVRLEPGATIGYHLHHEDAEIYYVLSGSGKFCRSETETIDVKEGDLTYIYPSQGHGILNDTEEDLLLLAIVYEEIKINN